MTAHLGSNIYFLFSEHGWENVTRLKEGEGERKVKKKRESKLHRERSLTIYDPNIFSR